MSEELKQKIVPIPSSNTVTANTPVAKRKATPSEASSTPVTQPKKMKSVNNFETGKTTTTKPLNQP